MFLCVIFHVYNFFISYVFLVEGGDVNTACVTHCTCVRAVVRCSGLTTFPDLPRSVRAYVSKIDLRGSQISTIDVTDFRGLKMGTVVDLRAQGVRTNFCTIEEKRITVLYDEEGCEATQETGTTTQETTTTTQETTTTTQDTTTTTQKTTTTQETTTTTQETTTTTQESTTTNTSWIFTAKRGPVHQPLPNSTTEEPKKTTTNQTTEEPTQDKPKDYVIVIIVVITVSIGVVVVTVVVCYCICFVDKHCNCCKHHTSRHRRFSGESLELFQVPENLPASLRFRPKDY